MRSFLHFLVILFFEIMYGIIAAFLYWVFSSLLFDKDGFALSKFNEIIYYLVILLPPSIYCWITYVRFKKEGTEKSSAPYVLGGITYLLGGLMFLLVLTGFHVFQ